MSQLTTQQLGERIDAHIRTCSEQWTRHYREHALEQEQAMTSRKELRESVKGIRTSIEGLHAERSSRTKALVGAQWTVILGLIGFVVWLIDKIWPSLI